MEVMTQEEKIRIWEKKNKLSYNGRRLRLSCRFNAEKERKKL